ncbi:hypothetical protein [Agromyces lapidis]|uniref:FtsX-like permease family protein n=1 Tax=Agromyces lapidis TaxID=279574 RepID=A0ABV5SN30_9MICO|nr:hypothetical protein [Agromyces lapidis]
MGSARTAFARANARLGVLSGIAAVVLLLSGIGTASLGTLAGAAAGGLRTGLESATGAAGAARWQIRLANDAAAQSEAAAAVLDRMLVPHGAAWQRSAQALPTPANAGGESFEALLTADPAVAERAELVEGEWPGTGSSTPDAGAPDALPTAVNAAAAAELGLEQGSLVTVDDGPTLVVVGIWEPADPTDPAWFGDPVVATGFADGAAGPFLVDESAVLAAPSAAVVRWTAVVDPATMTPDDAAALRAQLPDVEPALRNQDDIGSSGLAASGGLHGTLSRLLAGLGAVRALAPVPVLLLAIAGVAALARLAALLGAARRGETLLLRARGASATRLARDTAVEVIAVGIPAAALGAISAELALGLLRPGEVRMPAIAWLVAATSVVIAVLLVAGRAFTEARRPVQRGSGDEQGRMPRTAVAGGVVLIAVAAGISLWQFRLYGSPLVTGASGAVEVDPLAVLAPVLVLLALSLLALGLARPIGALFERLAAARPALIPALPMRQLARRGSLFASASLVTMIAVAGLTLAAVFAGAWQSVDRHAAALATGGEVRVSFPGRDVVRGPDPLATGELFAEVPGVVADGPVFRGEVRLGSDAATLVGAPASGIEAFAPGTGLAAAADDLAPSAEAAAAPLPDGAATLEVEVGVRAPGGTPGRVGVWVWLLTGDGAAMRLPAGSVDIAAGGGVAELELPDAAGLRLLGLSAGLVDSPGARGVQVSFGGLGVDGATPSRELAGDLETVELSASDPEARAPLAGGGETLPIVLGAELATRISAGVGDAVDFRIVTGGAEIDAVVAGVVPAVPTAGGNALLVDLGALERAAFDADAGVPQFGERWLASSDPVASAESIDREQRTAATSTTRADASSAQLITPAIATFWLGAAGALLFALISLLALASALAGSRFGEIVVLRVLGVAPRVQARARFAELAATVLAAIAMGAVIGGITAWLTARELARATIADAPASLEATLGVELWPWLAGLAAFALLAALVAASAARAVRRTASRPGLREEER